jgi:hypothetical protein
MRLIYGITLTKVLFGIRRMFVDQGLNWFWYVRNYIFVGFIDAVRSWSHIADKHAKGQGQHKRDKHSDGG